MAGKYDWGKGGKVHSIPKATHEQNVAAKKALGGSLDLTAPPTGVQAVREANSAADMQYGPQVASARQAQTNVAPWFQDFQARVAGYAKAAQAQAAPILAQAQGYQTGAAAQAPPGLDPNSAAGQQATQAAQGRQALAQLGMDALNTNATATQDYFGGQKLVADRQQPQVQAGADQKLANAESQRGNAVNTFLTGARQNAQNYAIARGTLNLNGAKAEADDAAKAAAVAQAAKDRRAARAVTKRGQDISKENAQARTDAAAATPNKYGIRASQWNHWSTSHRQRVIDAFNEKGKKGKGTDAADHASAVHEATGKIENQVQDIIGRWNSHMTDQTDDTTKPINDANGKKPNTPGWKPTYKGRNLTPSEIKKVLGADKTLTPQMIHIALLRNAKPPKPLDQASIDYLHNLNKNVRIPRDWLAGASAGGRTPGDTSPPAGRDIGGGGPSSASRGGTATAAEILKNPSQYSAVQVKAARSWQAKGRGNVPIDEDGGAG